MFPGYLREAGYYCTNNFKEDYNLEKPEGTWDDSSKKAHWRNRGPGPAVLRRLQQRDHAREPDPRKSGPTSARSGPRPHPRLSSRHAGGPPRLGPVLRQHHHHGLAGQLRLDELEKDGLARRHDRLLLRRPRRRACRAASAAPTTRACTSASSRCSRRSSATWRRRITRRAHSATGWSASWTWRPRC